MRISDWSSDVCSSDLLDQEPGECTRPGDASDQEGQPVVLRDEGPHWRGHRLGFGAHGDHDAGERGGRDANRSEEHTSELQSLMRISYAVFCLKKKNNNNNKKHKSKQKTSIQNNKQQTD